MELIKAIKEKSHMRKESDIRQQAKYLITVADFDSSLYIAYADTPLIPIEESWTSKEILQELSKIRQNYVNSKLKEPQLHKCSVY